MYEFSAGTRSMEGWIAGLLQTLRIQAPPGFVYLGHSIRSGSASAMAAIGVPRHLYVWVGGWSPTSRTVDKHYIEPTVMPTPAAHALFGWLLQRSYQSDAGVWDYGSARVFCRIRC